MKAPKAESNQRKMNHFWWLGRNRMAQSAGLRVSATMPEMITDIEIVTANCRYITPVSPPRKATGRYTAHSTSTIAITGPLTWLIALIVASRAESFSSCMMRSTFSTTTMASSTTMPMANTSPNSVSVLTENPNNIMPAKVPMIATGTAITGMMVARQLPRKRNTTSTTNATASKNVFATSLIDTSMYFVVSKGTS